MSKYDNSLNQLIYKTSDFIKNIYDRNTKIIDFEKTSIGKNTDRTIYDLENSALDGYSEELYNILFEMSYIPIYIDEVLLINEMHNAVITYSKYGVDSYCKKAFRKLCKMFNRAIFTYKLRSEYHEKIIKSIIPSNKSINMRIIKDADYIKNIFNNFCDTHKSEYKLCKLRYYNPFILFKKKLEKTLKTIYYHIDYIFNYGKDLKNFANKNMTNCDKTYKNTITAMKDAIESLNSNKFKDFITETNIDKMIEPCELERDLFKASNKLINFCETSIVKIVFVHNLMESDKYRKFR